MITNQSVEWNLNGIGAWPPAKRWNRALRAWCAFTLFAALTTWSAQGAQTALAVASVSASANDGNVPANTVDGSLATRWSASGDGQWIRYDLGANQSVGSVAIAWYKGDLRAARFDIRTSLDQSTWTQVFSGVSSGATTGFETYDVVDSTARYVSIVCHGNSVDLWNSITEVDLFAPASGTTLNWQLLSKELFTLQWNCETGTVCQVQASSNFVTWVDVSPPLSSTAVTQTWSENVTVLPAAAWPVRYYRVKKLSSTPPPQTLTVVASVANASEGGANPGTFTFTRNGSTASNLTARYSIGGTAVNGADYSTISGSVTIPSGSSVATLTISPIDNTAVEGNRTVVLTVSADSGYAVGSPSSATVTIADNDSPPPPGGTNLPSGLLSLTNWKLTLPVETSHAGSPDEYRQPELAGFQDPSYFYVNSAHDGVVFTAPCGGATTSGSGYPRSELREMTSGGTANASWSTTSGTHTMEIRQAVTHLPVVKPHVVVGQVHNAADDVIVFRLEGSKLFVDQNGVNGPVLTTSYQLGTVFTTKFVARNGGVEAYYNGQYIYTYPVSTSGCYFKAGCYTQSNTSRGDAPTAYGQVVIYNVTVTHQ